MFLDICGQAAHRGFHRKIASREYLSRSHVPLILTLYSLMPRSNTAVNSTSSGTRCYARSLENGCSTCLKHCGNWDRQMLLQPRYASRIVSLSAHDRLFTLRAFRQY